MLDLKYIGLIIVLAPLLGAMITGLGVRQIPRETAHRLTIALVGISLLLSLYLAKLFLIDGIEPYDVNIYTWASGQQWFSFNFHIEINSLCVLILVCIMRLIN